MKILEKTAKNSIDKEKISALFFIVKEVLEKAIIQLKKNEKTRLSIN
jgi:hypothetical protein